MKLKPRMGHGLTKMGKRPMVHSTCNPTRLLMRRYSNDL